VTQVLDFASKPTLTGERVILRPFVDEDTPALLAALGDPDVRILTSSVHDEAAARTPASPEEERLAAEWYATRSDTDDDGFERLGLHRISLEVYASDNGPLSTSGCTQRSILSPTER
jgi:hypothetical protein